MKTEKKILLTLLFNTMSTSKEKSRFEQVVDAFEGVTPDTEQTSFEKYLEYVCFEANPNVLDDDMPDFFNDWLGNQNGEDYIRLADEYATSRDTYWKERVRKIKEKVERVRLDVDVIKCDCGEPYKDSDLDLSVGELEQAIDTLLDNLK